MLSSQPCLHTKCCLSQTLSNYPSLIIHKALLFLLGDRPKHPFVPKPFAPRPGSDQGQTSPTPDPVSNTPLTPFWGVYCSHQETTEVRQRSDSLISSFPYHARVDGGLLDVSGDAGDKCISVLKVSVEVGLWKDVNTQCKKVQTSSTCRSIFKMLNAIITQLQSSFDSYDFQCSPCTRIALIIYTAFTVSFFLNVAWRYVSPCLLNVQSVSYHCCAFL